MRTLLLKLPGQAFALIHLVTIPGSGVSPRTSQANVNAWNRRQVPIARPARFGGDVTQKLEEVVMYEWMSWLALLLLAQWFFGNLYEAIALVPNLMPLIALKSRAGEALFKTKARSPIAYYVPASALALLLLAVLTIMALLRHGAGAPYILSACGFVFAGGALTVYIVRSVNLELFFEPPADLVRAGRLLSKWRMLNYIRLTLSLAAIVMMILWTRTVITP
jgi:hypothetical protein